MNNRKKSNSLVSSNSQKTNITIFTENKPSFKKSVSNLLYRIPVFQKIIMFGIPLSFILVFPHLALNSIFWFFVLAFEVVNLIGNFKYSASTDDFYIELHRKPKIDGSFRKELKEKIKELNSDTKLEEQDYVEIYEVYSGKRNFYETKDLVFRSKKSNPGIISISVTRSRILHSAFKSALSTEEITNNLGAPSKQLKEVQESVVASLQSLEEGILDDSSISEKILELEAETKLRYSTAKKRYRSGFSKYDLSRESSFFEREHLNRSRVLENELALLKAVQEKVNKSEK